MSVSSKVSSSVAPGSAVEPESVLRDDVLAMSAYHVADARGMIKLDAMENPYALPESVRKEIAFVAANAALNRYPDPTGASLQAILKSTMKVPAGVDLILGNGSDELIQVLCTAVAKPNAVILGVEPSFVMYRILARAAGTRYVGVPLQNDFSLDAPALLSAIAEHKPALVFLAYPNNPTGNLFDRGVIEQIIQFAPGIVVVDEAYHVFAQTSFLPDITRFPNLLVMRTLSKFGLAGLRLGFLCGAPQWISQLNKVRLPYNVGVLTQAVAEAVLTHAEVLEDQADQIRNARSAVTTALRSTPGVEVFPSAANFVLFRVPSATAVFDGLVRRGVLIKNLGGANNPLLNNCLRVTVGTEAENRAFLAALSGALQDAKNSHA